VAGKFKEGGPNGKLESGFQTGSKLKQCGELRKVFQKGWATLFKRTMENTGHLLTVGN
jgi:hypothetical protein